MLVENDLKSNNMNWNAFVKVRTIHYVFLALYSNLKRAIFLIWKQGNSSSKN